MALVTPWSRSLSCFFRVRSLRDIFFRIRSLRCIFRLGSPRCNFQLSSLRCHLKISSLKYTLACPNTHRHLQVHPSSLRHTLLGTFQFTKAYSSSHQLRFRSLGQISAHISSSPTHQVNFQLTLAHLVILQLRFNLLGQFSTHLSSLSCILAQFI